MNVHTHMWIQNWYCIFATIVRVVYSILSGFYFFIGIHWNLFIFVFGFSCVYRGIGRILSRMEEELIQWNRLRKMWCVDIMMMFNVEISNAKGDSKFRNVSLKIPFPLIISWKFNCLDFASMFNRRISFVWRRQLCSSWCLIYRVFWKVCNYSRKDGEITLWYENYISTFSVSHIVSNFNYNLLNFLF